MEQEVAHRSVVHALSPLLSAMDIAQGLAPEVGRHLAICNALLSGSLT
jgi:hypothetical protein